MIKKAISGLSLFSLVMLLRTLVFAGVPTVSDFFVTDVTPRSFSVVWAASEACSSDIDVYEDVDGLIAVTYETVEPHPVECGDQTIKEAAENNGVMKVRITGLYANSTYYFQTLTTSKSTGDTTRYPESSPLMAVTTELETARTFESNGNVIPFSNDIIIEECYLEDAVTPAEGTILLATVEGGNYPLTAFVGDGVDPPYALIDLNNMYCQETFQNLDLLHGENLTLLNFRGFTGHSIVTHRMPEDLLLSEVKPAEMTLGPGWNFFSAQLEPHNADLEIVLAPIWDNLEAIWAYDTLTNYWYRYDTNSPFPWLNDLREIHSRIGYWILLNNSCSLTVHGELGVDDPIPLYAGWNLIGYRSIESVDLLDAIEPIVDKVISIWTFDTERNYWYRYDVNNPFPWLNDLSVLTPGKAYWVNVTEDCEW